MKSTGRWQAWALVLVLAAGAGAVPPESFKGMFYVRSFYLYFTGLLVLGFAAYIAVDVYGFLRRRKRG